jgi:uncharacterized protein (TIRG00374 family)
VASRIGRIFEATLLPLGVAALAFLVWQIGPSGIVERLSHVRWWFIAIIAQEMVTHYANTAGLLACLPLDRRTLGFWYTAAARLAGESVNATMPTANVGGELLKISLLSRRAPVDRVTAGISAAYATQALAQMLFTMLALPFALPALDLPVVMKGTIVSFVVAGVIGTYVFAQMTIAGSFGKIHGVLQRVGLGKEGSRTHTATTRIDDAARSSHLADPRGFAISVLQFLVGWAWGVVEVAIILHAFGLEVDVLHCLAIESLSSFVDAVFFFVPGQMGTRELGLAGITKMLGLGAPIGVSIGLLRRGRVLVWAAIGLLCLAWFRRIGELSPPVVDAPKESNEGEGRGHTSSERGDVRGSSVG